MGVCEHTLVILDEREPPLLVLVVELLELALVAGLLLDNVEGVLVEVNLVFILHGKVELAEGIELVVFDRLGMRLLELFT